MAVNILGVVSLVIFYLIILGIGLWAARRTRQVGGGIHQDTSERAMIGGRDIGLLVGSFTMTGELDAGYPLLEAC